MRIYWVLLKSEFYCMYPESKIAVCLLGFAAILALSDPNGLVDAMTYLYDTYVA